MDDGRSPPLRAVEKLDVEGEEERQERIRESNVSKLRAVTFNSFTESVLEKLNATSTKKTSTFPSFDFGNRTTHEIKPPSERSLVH
jgi:hypothetical protein